MNIYDLRFTIYALLAGLLAGCASAPVTHGIPNFAVVEPGVYRGGQPDAEGWRYLQSLGVKRVVKLNEGTEAAAERIGFSVFKCPLSLPQQLGIAPIWSTEALNDICYMLPAPVFVHCEHGQDRTGLIIACYRVKVEGWSKADAEKEMLAHGFHKSLFGLWQDLEGLRAMKLPLLLMLLAAVLAGCVTPPPVAPPPPPLPLPAPVQQLSIAPRTESAPAALQPPPPPALIGDLIPVQLIGTNRLADLQASADLSHWTNLTVVYPGGGIAFYTNLYGANPPAKMYYRLKYR